MSSVRNPDKEPCWLLWELYEGKMYLLAICTEEANAITYKRGLVRDAKNFGMMLPRLHIEKSQLNHLYGRRER